MNLFHNFFDMKSTKNPSETTKAAEWNNVNASHGWRKVVTSVSLALASWLFSSCDKVPNNQIILDPNEESVAFSFEYQFGSGESGSTIDYNVFVRKDGEKYQWTIEHSDWMFSDTINIESDNLDWLFNEISDRSDSEYITEKTRYNRDSKLNFAKKAYKNYILKKSKKWVKSPRFKIKYKK